MLGTNQAVKFARKLARGAGIEAYRICDENNESRELRLTDIERPTN